MRITFCSGNHPIPSFQVGPHGSTPAGMPTPVKTRGDRSRPLMSWRSSEKEGSRCKMVYDPPF